MNIPIWIKSEYVTYIASPSFLSSGRLLEPSEKQEGKSRLGSMTFPWWQYSTNSDFWQEIYHLSSTWELKVFTTKKPDNPPVLTTLPIVPSLCPEMLTFCELEQKVLYKTSKKGHDRRIDRNLQDSPIGQALGILTGKIRIPINHGAGKRGETGGKGLRKALRKVVKFWLRLVWVRVKRRGSDKCTNTRQGGQMPAKTGRGG